MVMGCQAMQPDKMLGKGSLIMTAKLDYYLRICIVFLVTAG